MMSNFKYLPKENGDLFNKKKVYQAPFHLEN
jgi:hypothetical protein